LCQSGEKAQVSVVPFGERPGRIGKDGQSPGDSPAGEKGDGERGTQRLGRGLQSSGQVEAGGWIFFEGAGGLEFRPQRGVDVGVVKFGASGGAAGQLMPEAHVGVDPPRLVDLMKLLHLEAWLRNLAENHVGSSFPQGAPINEQRCLTAEN